MSWYRPVQGPLFGPSFWDFLIIIAPQAHYVHEMAGYLGRGKMMSGHAERYDIAGGVHRRLWSWCRRRIFLKMKSYDDKRYSGMLDTSYEASKSPIRVVGGVHRPDGHPKMT